MERPVITALNFMVNEVKRLTRNAFNAFANRVDIDQTALLSATRLGFALSAYENMIIYEPTQVDLTNNVFILCIYIIIHSSLLWEGVIAVLN